MATIGTALTQRCAKQRETSTQRFPRSTNMTNQTLIQPNTALSPRQVLNDQRVLRISELVTKIATWNVRSMFKAGKLHNTTQEMDRLNIDILGISDMRWPGQGQITQGDKTVYYVGNNDTRHQYGVAIILSKDIQRTVKHCILYSDRAILLQLEARPRNINIIQVYAPTTDKSDQEIESFYDHLKSILKHVNKQEICIIMGDFNAKVGKGKQGQYVGDHGLGKRNDRGDRLIQFCEEENLIISNTFFQLPARRLYTWTAPANKPDRIIRNQIDYILVNRRYKNNIKSVKTYPGADVNSDHTLLVSKFQTQFKKVKKKRRPTKIDVSLLKCPDKTKQVAKDIDLALQKLINNQPIINRNVNHIWADVKKALTSATEKHLKPEKHVKKKEWMTTEILGLMEERRLAKNNTEKYKQIERVINKKIKEAKELWMADKCLEIEELAAKYDSHNMHKKIKEIVGNRKTKMQTTLRDEDGTIAVSTEDKLKLWTKYIEDLFEDTRIKSLDILPQENVGPDITKDEIRYAIKYAKNNKAVGPEEIPTELIKLIEDDKLEILVSLFNLIYSTSIIPNEWLRSTFITLPKTPHPNKCQDYRLISLMSHTLKIFLKIIHRRIYKKCEENFNNTQFGFRNGFGTREALFSINVLIQRCRDVNQDVHLCFIDYQKAFDRVKHNKLIRLLQNIGLDTRDIKLIENLYWNQTASILVEDNSTPDIEICRGVRQGCILSPLLFNVYSETIFNNALNDRTEGININGQIINNLRYADDSVLLAESSEDLQILLNAVYASSIQYGLDMNTKKTKYMVVSKKITPQTNLQINHTTVEQVRSYKYLGCTVNDRWEQHQEIKSRIEQARNAFGKMRPLLCNRNLSIELRKRMVKCYVFPILLYGMEAWTLTEETMRRINAFELWLYRRILRIPWVDHITNDEVLRRMNTTTEIMYLVKRRKLEYLGHVMRNEKYGLLQLIIQGKIDSKRGPGRRRTSWLKNLRQWFGRSTTSLFRAAASKIKIAMLVANLR